MFSPFLLCLMALNLAAIWFQYCIQAEKLAAAEAATAAAQTESWSA